MIRLIARGAAALAVVLAGILVLSSQVSAHERRSVADKYTFVVGFDVEPVFQEEKNAVYLRVTDAQTNAPVEGVEKDLKVDVTAGGQTKTFNLAARRSEPGVYTASLIPTKGGSWVFTFKGTIDGTQINERFESGPGRFNEPQPQSELQFPVSVPTTTELRQEIQTGGQPAEAGAQPSTVQADVQRALDKADDAQRTGVTVGAVGIVIGLLGLAAGGYALASRRSRTSGPRSAEPI
jgi:hypothetical protein